MNSKKIIAFVIFIVIAAGVFGAVLYFSNGTNQQTSQPVTTPSVTTVTTTTTTSNSNPTPTTPSQPTTNPAPVATVAPATKANKYKNGTYAVTGTYVSPAGVEHIGVSLTVTNDIVTASTVTPEAGDGRSMSYQQRFASGYQQYVVGQPLDSINIVDSVSGSSLTPHGFNDAVAQIKSEALS